MRKVLILSTLLLVGCTGEDDVVRESLVERKERILRDGPTLADDVQFYHNYQEAMDRKRRGAAAAERFRNARP